MLSFQNISPWSDVINASRVWNDYFSIRYSTSSTKIATTAIDFSNIPRYPHTQKEKKIPQNAESPLQLAFLSLIFSLFSIYIDRFSLSFPFSPPLVHLNVHHYWQKASPQDACHMCPFYGIPPLPHESILPSQLTLLFFGPSKEIQTIYLTSYTFHGRRKTSKKMFSSKTLQFWQSESFRRIGRLFNL